jgi:hypothetical protein
MRLAGQKRNLAAAEALVLVAAMSAALGSFQTRGRNRTCN